MELPCDCIFQKALRRANAVTRYFRTSVCYLTSLPYVECCVRSHRSELMRAAIAGNTSLVQELLRAQPQSHKGVDIFGFSPLMYAVMGGSAACVLSLLQQGANPNHYNKWYETALALSCFFPMDITVPFYLLHFGSILSPITCHSIPVLYYACVSENHELVKIFLQKGASLNYPEEELAYLGASEEVGGGKRYGSVQIRAEMDVRWNMQIYTLTTGALTDTKGRKMECDLRGAGERVGERARSEYAATYTTTTAAAAAAVTPSYSAPVASAPVPHYPTAGTPQPHLIHTSRSDFGPSHSSGGEGDAGGMSNGRIDADGDDIPLPLPLTQILHKMIAEIVSREHTPSSSASSSPLSSSSSSSPRPRLPPSTLLFANTALPLALIMSSPSTEFVSLDVDNTRVRAWLCDAEEEEDDGDEEDGCSDEEEDAADECDDDECGDCEEDCGSADEGEEQEEKEEDQQPSTHVLHTSNHEPEEGKGADVESRSVGGGVADGRDGRGNDHGAGRNTTATATTTTTASTSAHTPVPLPLSSPLPPALSLPLSLPQLLHLTATADIPTLMYLYTTYPRPVRTHTHAHAPAHTHPCTQTQTSTQTPLLASSSSSSSSRVHPPLPLHRIHTITYDFTPLCSFAPHTHALPSIWPLLLPIAAKKKSPELISLFIAMGADINMKNMYGYTLLHYFAFKQEWDVVFVCLLFGADANIPYNEEGNTLLMWLCMQGTIYLPYIREIFHTTYHLGNSYLVQNPDFFQKFPNAKLIPIKLNSRNKRGQDALTLSAQRHYQCLVRVLLELEAHIVTMNMSTNTQATQATSNVHTESDVQAQMSTSTHTTTQAGTSASTHTQVATSTSTSTSSACVTAASSLPPLLPPVLPPLSRNTPLYTDNALIACLRRNFTPHANSPMMKKPAESILALLTLLLESGMDVNHIGEGGCSALMVACQYQSIHVVTFLLNQEADVLACDVYGRNALFFTLQRNDEYIIDIVELLIQRRVDIHCKDEDHCTVLMLAAQKHQLSVMQLLLTEVERRSEQKEEPEKGNEARPATTEKQELEKREQRENRAHSGSGVGTASLSSPSPHASTHSVMDTVVDSYINMRDKWGRDVLHHAMMSTVLYCENNDRYYYNNIVANNKMPEVHGASSKSTRATHMDTRTSSSVLGAEYANIDKLSTTTTHAVNNPNISTSASSAAVASAPVRRVRVSYLPIRSQTNTHQSFHSSPASPSSFSNALACISFLLSRRATPNTADIDGWTPLLYAIYHNNLALVHMLIEAGADVCEESERRMLWVKCVGNDCGNDCRYCRDECRYSCDGWRERREREWCEGDKTTRIDASMDTGLGKSTDMDHCHAGGRDSGEERRAWHTHGDDNGHNRSDYNVGVGLGADSGSIGGGVGGVGGVAGEDVVRSAVDHHGHPCLHTPLRSQHTHPYTHVAHSHVTRSYTSHLHRHLSLLPWELHPPSSENPFNFPNHPFVFPNVYPKRISLCFSPLSFAILLSARQHQGFCHYGHNRTRSQTRTHTQLTTQLSSSSSTGSSSSSSCFLPSSSSSPSLPAPIVRLLLEVGASPDHNITNANTTSVTNATATTTITTAHDPASHSAAGAAAVDATMGWDAAVGACRAGSASVGQNVHIDAGASVNASEGSRAGGDANGSICSNIHAAPLPSRALPPPDAHPLPHPRPRTPLPQPLLLLSDLLASPLLLASALHTHDVLLYLLLFGADANTSWSDTDIPLGASSVLPNSPPKCLGEGHDGAMSTSAADAATRACGTPCAAGGGNDRGGGTCGGGEDEASVEDQQQQLRGHENAEEEEDRGGAGSGDTAAAPGDDDGYDVNIDDCVDSDNGGDGGVHTLLGVYVRHALTTTRDTQNTYTNTTPFPYSSSSSSSLIRWLPWVITQGLPPPSSLLIAHLLLLFGARLDHARTHTYTRIREDADTRARKQVHTHTHTRSRSTTCMHPASSSLPSLPSLSSLLTSRMQHRGDLWPWLERLLVAGADANDCVLIHGGDGEDDDAKDDSVEDGGVDAGDTEGADGRHAGADVHDSGRGDRSIGDVHSHSCDQSIATPTTTAESIAALAAPPGTNAVTVPLLTSAILLDIAQPRTHIPPHMHALSSTHMHLPAATCPLPPGQVQQQAPAHAPPSVQLCTPAQACDAGADVDTAATATGTTTITAPACDGAAATASSAAASTTPGICDDATAPVSAGVGANVYGHAFNYRYEDFVDLHQHQRLDHHHLHHDCDRQARGPHQLRPLAHESTPHSITTIDTPASAYSLSSPSSSLSSSSGSSSSCCSAPLFPCPSPISALLAFRAHVDHVNEKGITALQLAMSCGREDIVMLLTRHCQAIGQQENPEISGSEENEESSENSAKECKSVRKRTDDGDYDEGEEQESTNSGKKRRGNYENSDESRNFDLCVLGNVTLSSPSPSSPDSSFPTSSLPPSCSPVSSSPSQRQISPAPPHSYCPPPCTLHSTTLMAMGTPPATRWASPALIRSSITAHVHQSNAHAIDTLCQAYQRGVGVDMLVFYHAYGHPGRMQEIQRRIRKKIRK